MEQPMNPKPFTEVEAGSYHKWLPSEYPLLAHNKVAAGRLLLRPRGFVVPHYADCSKVGYVLQGENGVAGLVFPSKSDEVVVNLKKGDLIPVPNGVSSWWFNDGDSDLEIIFLGESKNAHVPGDISYFVLSGILSLLNGFSPEYVGETYSLNGEETTQFLKSQSNALIFSIQQTQSLPKPPKYSKFVYNIDAAAPDGRVKGGAGAVTTVTESKFPFIGQSGLTAILEKLDANAVRSPVYVAEPYDQLIYVAKGRGKIQIVGFSSKIDAEVKMGQLILVPKFFAVGKIAGEDGLECISIITATHPVVEELAGKTSVLEALSPEVFQVSFNVTAEFEKLLRSKITNASPVIRSSD
ncbi:12S seed storage protein CRD-like [Cucurbita maxima]|uniref:12S seed storage protein CRD-like n=1 Tax=Cucurbita maxima TaxID=3661 RepID=A0A6J1JDB2_CUCMA|nr:12S seed storage protein CRD-like [Cucurbita maxima]